MLNYPVMYSLSEKESGNKHARNGDFLSRIENSSFIKSLICRRSYDCEMRVENYMFLRFTIGVSAGL